VGTFVAQLHVERDHSRLTNFFEISKESGVVVSERVLNLEVIPAKLQVAKALSLTEGEFVICVKRCVIPRTCR
jgi:DNA-binding GntR family transcriptional regulator